MPCLPEEFLNVVCPNKKIGLFMTTIFVVILSLLVYSMYLVFKPVECIDDGPKFIYRNQILDSDMGTDEASSCTESSIFKSPYTVALIERTSNLHICTGVIVSRSWILTAAHCLSSCEDVVCLNYVIRAGSSYSNRGGSVHNITSIVIHPNFNGTDLANNMALVQIIDIIINNTTLKLAEISSSSVEFGEPAMLVGFASYSKADVAYKDNALKILQFTIVPHAFCNHHLKVEYVKLILTQQMCGAFTTKRGGCYTDAGGALIRNGTLVGIGMFSKMCYSCDFHISVIVNITHYATFINRYIKK